MLFCFSFPAQTSPSGPEEEACWETEGRGCYLCPSVGYAHQGSQAETCRRTETPSFPLCFEIFRWNTIDCQNTDLYANGIKNAEMNWTCLFIWPKKSEWTLTHYLLILHKLDEIAPVIFSAQSHAFSLELQCTSLGGGWLALGEGFCNEELEILQGK